MSRDTTVLPSRDTASLTAAESVLASDGEVLLSSGAQSVPLPAELRLLLADVVRAMRRGQAITLAPLSQQLTTQQAADLLGVSRPTLVKLLDQGLITYDTPGRHRRLRLADVLAYQQSRRTQQREALAELSADAQDAGLYDAEPGTVQSALADARRKHA